MSLRNIQYKVLELLYESEEFFNEETVEKIRDFSEKFEDWCDDLDN